MKNVWFCSLVIKGKRAKSALGRWIGKLYWETLQLESRFKNQPVRLGVLKPK